MTRGLIGSLEKQRGGRHDCVFMKKFSILGILALASMAGLLWQWIYHPGDDQIRHRMVGTWSLDSDPKKVIENRADGSYVMRKSGIETVKGTWQIKNGYSIGTATNVPRQDGVFQVESNKVLTIFGDTLIVLSIDGHTRLVCHRQ